MTEHKDISGLEIIAIDEAIRKGGLSLENLVIIDRHMEHAHGDLAKISKRASLVEEARHQAAVLKGEVDPKKLIPPINFVHLPRETTG